MKTLFPILTYIMFIAIVVTNVAPMIANGLDATINIMGEVARVPMER